jgi:hypothetical protein
MGEALPFRGKKTGETLPLPIVSTCSLPVVAALRPVDMLQVEREHRSAYAAIRSTPNGVQLLEARYAGREKERDPSGRATISFLKGNPYAVAQKHPARVAKLVNQKHGGGSMVHLNDAQIMKALFGRQNGGVPKELRAHLGYAADAINAYQRGLSVPQVALNYRYEPIQAMIMIANCCEEYGFDLVARHVPAHIMSVVQVQFSDRPGLQPSPRPRGCTSRAPK